MSDPLSRELDAVLRRLQSEHDVLQFTQEMLPAAGTRLPRFPMR